MNIIIGQVGWASELRKAIDESNEGDVIVCRTDNMKEIAIRAKARMCPEKNITFTIEH